MVKLKMDGFRIATLLVVVVLAASVVFLYLRQPNIAYVRSQDLIEKYQGTIEARSEFNKKKEGMMANVDSLEVDFERAKNQYFSTAAGLSGPQRIEQEKILTQRQSQLLQYGEAINERIKEEDSKMMQEVLNQINSYVEMYSKERGLDIVLGTTLSGSLLYGNDKQDITDELVVRLNEKYKGSAK